MIGFVIISHSKNLADEVIKLCNEMKNYDFPIVNGSGKDKNILGSDPEVIKKAIELAYLEDGVLILGDIGSSISNAKKAVKLLDNFYNKDKIEIADAPLVEGAIVAMAINSGKATIEDIVLELKELKSFNKVD